MESTFVSVNGVRLHLVLDGPEDGHLVILLHGFPEFWYAWKEHIEPLASAGFRVLVPDQRGYNLSDKPMDVASYRLEEAGKDILGLMDCLGRETASLIGHDWGGGAAWWLAANHPSRIESLGILNMPHPMVIQRTLMRSPRQLFRSLYAAFFQIPWLPEAVLRNNDWEMLVTNLQETSRPGTFSQEDIEQYRRAWWQPGAMTGMLNWYRAALRYQPGFPSGGKISIPTLIVWGAEDSSLSSGMAQDSIDLCEKGQLIMFEDATHWLQHEEVLLISALLVDFLSEGLPLVER